MKTASKTIRDDSRLMAARERLRLTEREQPCPEPDLSIRNSITRIFKNIEEQKASPLRTIQDQWKLIAGGIIAGHSRPDRIAGDILYVFVDSSAWMQEIVRFHGHDIVQQIRKLIGPDLVRQARFQVNPDQCRAPAD